MNHQSRARRFLFCLLQACGIGLLAGSWASAAIAAGPTPQRTLGPAAGLPNLIVDNGVRIGGTYVPVVSSGIPTIRSSVMIHSPNGMNGLGCRFPISFGIRNDGSGPTPSSFDVIVAINHRGPGPAGQGTVNSVGYSMNPLKPNSVDTVKGSFDVLPGSYSLWVDIDKYHKIKQVWTNHLYGFAFNAVCGNGIYRPPGGPAMHMPAPNQGPGGHAGASGMPANRMLAPARNPGPIGVPSMRNPGPNGTAAKRMVDPGPQQRGPGPIGMPSMRNPGPSQ